MFKFNTNETYEQWYERTHCKKFDKSGWDKLNKQSDDKNPLTNVEIDITESGKFKDIAQENVGKLNEYDNTAVSYKIVKSSDYNEGGSAYMLNGKTAITVSSRTFRINKATDDLNLGENQIYGTTFREFVHLLFQSKEGMNKDFWKEIRKLQCEYKKNKYSDTWITDKISVYADTNIDEFFAEGFTQGKLSKTPSLYSKKIVEITDKYFKKEKSDVPKIKIVPEGQEKTFKKYTSNQIMNFAKENENIINKYITKESKWSGNIIIDDGAEKYGELWSCDIIMSSETSPMTIMHEQLHARLVSYFDSKIYNEFKKIEEASVQFMTQEICNKESIEVMESVYDDMVKSIKELNHLSNLYENDYDFALDLFNVELPDRIDWLEAKIYDTQKKEETIEDMVKFNELMQKLY